MLVTRYLIVAIEVLRKMKLINVFLYFIAIMIADKVKINYNLVAALLANAFFSTFPKRTEKTHPTLQDFNFTHFFKSLHM